MKNAAQAATRDRYQLLKMTKLNSILILTIFLNLSCNSAKEKENIDYKLMNTLKGEWELIQNREDIREIFYKPIGFAFSNDSIEFFNGFFQREVDSVTRERKVNYFGNFTTYKTNKDSIFIKNLINGKWEFKWKVIKVLYDTLQFSSTDSTIQKYVRLSYDLDSIPKFDQIIYSSSGCYGTCPIIDISVDRNGKVIFQGEGYVKPLGFHKGQLDNNFIQYVFDKFYKANPIRLIDEYSVGHSDDQTITTTYIREGKIIKTIDDYGLAGTSELVWAYIPIGNIHRQIELTSLPMDEPFYPKLSYYTFRKGGKILPLMKSESFYLWTELFKSKVVEKEFRPIYTISFSRNYTYWGPDPNKERKNKFELNSIKTDGQFYTFEFKNEKPITYDLGYNFITMNFDKKDFRKPNDWEN